MQCMREVAELLRGKILVGHALKNDLAVLMLDHHPSMIRDTAKYPPFMRVSVCIVPYRSHDMLAASTPRW